MGDILVYVTGDRPPGLAEDVLTLDAGILVAIVGLVGALIGFLWKFSSDTGANKSKLQEEAVRAEKLEQRVQSLETYKAETASRAELASTRKEMIVEVDDLDHRTRTLEGIVPALVAKDEARGAALTQLEERFNSRMDKFESKLDQILALVTTRLTNSN